MEKLRWCEIADFSETARMNALSSALEKFGLANEVTFVQATSQSLASVLKQAQKDFGQIRISGTLCETALEHFDNIPLSANLVGAADSVVFASGQWWPRNFLSEGIQRAIVNDVKTLDIGEAVFVLGTGWEARSVIAALSKIGFRRFTLSDKTEAQGEAFIETLKRKHFDVEFQFVPRKMITQLPSVHSFGINTLVKGRDDGALDELIYFNYLNIGGVWLDLPLVPSNDALAEEADAAGAFVESGIKVAVATDALWAEACFFSPQFRFDRANYRSILSKSLRS